MSDSAFDEYADDYEKALAQGLSVSGENKDYFAQKRVEWTAARLSALGIKIDSILDYGCGTGSASPFLHTAFNAATLSGVDISSRSVEVAAKLYGEMANFSTLDDYKPSQQETLAFCNGVFHHIPIAERVSCAKYVFDSLKSGGIFALWENNPLNPGTRYIMSKIPFDHDAITLLPWESRRLVESVGFQHLRTDFQFIFPNALKPLRPIEKHLAALPLGAQYLVLARKP